MPVEPRRRRLPWSLIKDHPGLHTAEHCPHCYTLVLQNTHNIHITKHISKSDTIQSIYCLLCFVQNYSSLISHNTTVASNWVTKLPDVCMTYTDSEGIFYVLSKAGSQSGVYWPSVGLKQHAKCHTFLILKFIYLYTLLCVYILLLLSCFGCSQYILLLSIIPSPFLS